MNESLAKNKNRKSNVFRAAYLRCSCDNEILVVRYDGEIDMLDLCLFQNQNSFKQTMTLWQKIRYTYNLFITGLPFTDQIVLNRNQIDELKGFLDNL